MTKRKPAPVVEWPAEKIELWPIEQIKPYPGNARRHPPEQIAGLAADMIADGVTQPILVADDDRMIIAGHGRRLAAIEAAKTDPRFARYPVVIARGWSAERKRAVRIKDNARGLQSTWDVDLLRAELTAFEVAKFDTSGLGFTADELAVIRAGWQSDIDVTGRFGANTAGIGARITVELAETADLEKARTAVDRAMKRAGIVCEIR